MSLLETRIKEAIARGFRGRLLPARLRRVVYTGKDALGDPTGPVPTVYPCEGMIDTFDAAYRAQAGIPEEDVKILIIAGSLAVTPKIGDTIHLRDQWWQVRTVETDPARATWEMRAFSVRAPS